MDKKEDLIIKDNIENVNQDQINDEESNQNKDEEPTQNKDEESNQNNEELIQNNDKESTQNQQDNKEQTNNQAEQDEQLTEDELSERLKRSTDFKDEGNQYFKNEEFDKSLELYTKALKECPAKFNDKRAIILNNKAVCRWKLMEKSNPNFKDENVKIEFEDIIKDLSDAIELNPSYFKPYLKRAEMNHRFGGDKLDNSLEDYKKLLELIPKDNRKLNDEIKYEIGKLEKEIEERNEKLKQEMFAQLKNLGNLCLRPFGLSTDNFKLQQNENGGYSVNFQQ